MEGPMEGLTVIHGKEKRSRLVDAVTGCHRHIRTMADMTGDVQLAKDASAIWLVISCLAYHSGTVNFSAKEMQAEFEIHEFCPPG